MNYRKHNQEDLPVLTEVATTGDPGVPLPYPQLIDLRLTARVAEGDGYDPYNSAPPLPQKAAGQA